jgi:hypothetical protein
MKTLQSISSRFSRTFPHEYINQISISLRWSGPDGLINLWHNLWGMIRAHWYFRRATYAGPIVCVFGKPFVQNRGRMLIRCRVHLVSTAAPLELVAAGVHLKLENRLISIMGVPYLPVNL